MCVCVFHIRISHRETIKGHFIVGFPIYSRVTPGAVIKLGIAVMHPEDAEGMENSTDPDLSEEV